MSRRRDAGLAIVSLVGFLAALALSETTLSVAFAILGAAGTLLFEGLAMRYPKRIGDPVRTHWERPAVQVGALVIAAIAIIGGSMLAPEAVLSTGIGALIGYLLVLALVRLL